MTVNDLIGTLEELADAGYGENEVEMVYQENYPLRGSIRGIALENDYNEEVGQESTVFIVEGYNEGYGDRAVFDVASNH
jgi:hypothetical protein